MKRLLVLLLAFMGSFGTLIAQNHLINGIVFDKNDKEISDVGVFGENGTLKAISDKNGCFRIWANDQEKLKFTHISHKEQIYIINFQDVKNSDSTFCILVEMEDREYELPEVSIVTNTPHLAYENKEVWVMDYNVSQKGLFLISGNGTDKTFTLLCLSSDQDTIARRNIPRDFDTFYEDAFGNLHILGNDSTYQVYCDGHDIHLLYGSKKDVFEQKVYPVAVSTDSLLVLKYELYSGQEIVYTTVNKNTKVRKTIAVSSSSAKEAVENWNTDNIRFALVDNDEYNPRKQNSMDNLARNNNVMNSAANTSERNSIAFHDEMAEVESRRENMKRNAAKKVLFKAVYCPSFFISDYLYIFDFENDNLMKFDAHMEIVDECPITFHKRVFHKRLTINDPWKKNIIMDKYTGKCYAEFEEDGRVSLKEVDLATGNITNQITLDKHTFPTNIQVFNGNVYYLFRNMTEASVDKRSLYKMKLE